MSIRQRPRIGITDTTYSRPVTVDYRDQNSIANRVYNALYGYEYVYIVAEGDDVILGEGPTIYRYDNGSYGYNEFQDLQEYTFTITGEETNISGGTLTSEVSIDRSGRNDISR